MAGKKVLAAFLSIVLAGTTVLSPNYMKQAAAVSVKSVKLNVSSKITMYTGSSKTIKVVSVKPKGSSKKVTYKSSKPGGDHIQKGLYEGTKSRNSYDYHNICFQQKGNEKSKSDSQGPCEKCKRE